MSYIDLMFCIWVLVFSGMVLIVEELLVRVFEFYFCKGCCYFIDV